MEPLGPITVYGADDRILGLDNELRYVYEVRTPDTHEINVNCQVYRASVKEIAPGVFWGSTHEVAAWEITRGASLLGRSSQAVEALEDAWRFIKYDPSFPDDPIWLAAIQYNLSLLVLHGLRPVEELEERTPIARQLLDSVTDFGPHGANRASWECVDRALAVNEYTLERRAQTLAERDG